MLWINFRYLQMLYWCPCKCLLVPPSDRRCHWHCFWIYSKIHLCFYLTVPAHPLPFCKTMLQDKQNIHCIFKVALIISGIYSNQLYFGSLTFALNGQQLPFSSRYSRAHQNLDLTMVKVLQDSGNLYLPEIRSYVTAQDTYTSYDPWENDSFSHK